MPDTFHCRWEELESGTRDMSQFVQWQTNMKNRDWQEQQNEVESFRLKAKISHEDAILSKHKLKENNRQLVQDIKQKVCQCFNVSFVYHFETTVYVLK